MQKLSDSIVVTKQQLYNMGLSVPVVDKAWEKIPKIYAGNRRSKKNERVIFADFQEVWCNQFKGVWITTTPTRPIRRFVKPITVKELMSFKQGMIYYNIVNILHYKPKLPYRRIKLLLYFIFINRTLGFNSTKQNREYPVAFGPEFNRLIKQALKDLVEKGYLTYYVPINLPNASKYYEPTSKKHNKIGAGTQRILRGYRGSFKTDEMEHLCMVCSYLTKAPQMWEYRNRYRMSWLVLYRMFRSKEQAKRVCKVLEEFTEVHEQP